MIRQRINGALHGAIYSINAAALLLGAAGLLSRILGVLRDRMLASHFGASRELDIYYTAFQIPDFLFNVFLLGAASSAIIPIFLKVEERDQAEARGLIAKLIKIFSIAAILISALAGILTPYLMNYAAPGFSIAERGATAGLARIMLLSPVLLGLSSIISSVMQSRRRFLVVALSSVFYNLGIIFGILVFLPLFGLPGLALGVILGAFLHFFIQFPVFSKLGFVLWLKQTSSAGEKLLDKTVKDIIRLSFPRVIALSVNNLTSMALVAISSTLASGSVSVFTFANNLSFLPTGLFGISFAVAAFPHLSENFLKKEREGFLENFYGSLHSILFWVMPLSLLFYVLRAQIVRVALGAGKFSWVDTRLTAASLGILALAIAANSIIPMLIRAFYALENTKKPFYINIFSAALTVVLSLIFINLLKSGGAFQHFATSSLSLAGLKDISILGIALGVVGGAFSDLILLSLVLRSEFKNKLGGSGMATTETPWDDTVKIVAASITSGFMAFGALRFINEFVSLTTFWGVLTQGAFAFVVGAFSYSVLLYLVGNREIIRLADTLRSKTGILLKIVPRDMGGEGIK